MTEIAGQNFPSKNPESLGQREKLSDEEMGNLLSSVGNHEAKSITLLLMRSGNIFTPPSLHSEMLNSQGINKGWRMHENNPFSYCSHSLAPIGLVAKETINEDLSTYGYAITRDGKELGIPLAGLLLDFSERHSISLNLLFGSTVSSSKEKTVDIGEGKSIEYKKRAPSTTLKILYELLTSPNLPMREVDLEKKAGSIGEIPRNLSRLSKLGLIQYRGIVVNKPFSLYKLSATIPEGELPIYREQSTLTMSVFDILKNYPDEYLTSEDIYNLLPKQQNERWRSEKFRRRRISGVLFFLAKHKYTEIENFYGGKQSEINIAEEQKIILSELLEIMYRFQNQDKEILEKGKRLAEAIISNPTRVSKLLRRAREASSFANASNKEATQEHILSIILSNSNGITNKDIQKLLEEKYDKKLGIHNIQTLSASLMKNKSVRMEKEGIMNRFYPNNPASAS